MDTRLAIFQTRNPNYLHHWIQTSVLFPPVVVCRWWMKYCWCAVSSLPVSASPPACVPAFGVCPPASPTNGRTRFCWTGASSRTKRRRLTISTKKRQLVCRWSFSWKGQRYASNAGRSVNIVGLFHLQNGAASLVQ